jgi:hypothetical protein
LRIGDAVGGLGHMALPTRAPMAARTFRSCTADFATTRPCQQDPAACVTACGTCAAWPTRAFSWPATHGRRMPVAQITEPSEVKSLRQPCRRERRRPAGYSSTAESVPPRRARPAGRAHCPRRFRQSTSRRWPCAVYRDPAAVRRRDPNRGGDTLRYMRRPSDDPLIQSLA